MKVTVADLRLLFPKPRAAKHADSYDKDGNRTYCVLGSLSEYCRLFFDDIVWHAPRGQKVSALITSNGYFPKAEFMLEMMWALRGDLPENTQLHARYISAIAMLNDRKWFEAAYTVLNDYLTKPMVDLFDLDVSHYFPAGTKV